MPEEQENLDETPEENDITPLEEELLDNAGPASEDDENLAESILDDTDEEGDLLNEDSDDITGGDLDVPGASLDDEDEAIGSEDEENNSYSLGDND